MSAGEFSERALPEVLGQLALLSPGDQDAIFQALSPAQAHALRRLLAGHAGTEEVGFAAHVQTLSSQEEDMARAEELTRLSRLDLDALPAGVVATLLLNSAEEARQHLVYPWSTERWNKVSALLTQVTKGALSHSSKRLLALLADGRHDRVAESNLFGPTTQIQASAPSIPLFGNPVKRIKSWLYA